MEEHHYDSMDPSHAQAVENEITKVKDQLQSFDAIAEVIERRRYKIHHIINFRKLVLHCKQLLGRNLDQRLRQAIDGLTIKDQIKELDRFRSMMRRLAERLHDIVVNSFDIPHELYFLCDNFLEYHNVEPCYIISESDEIALTPFSFILQNIGKFDEEYFFRDFWNIISKEEFYIVQIVSDLVETSSALDWPVILHEISHIINSEKGTEDKYFPGISIYDALVTLATMHKGKLSPKAAGVRSAAKKLFASEFLADYLVTRCYGPTFGWRFTRKWVDLRHVFEPSRMLQTHPDPKRRIESIISEVKSNLKMPNMAEFLKNEAATLSRSALIQDTSGKSVSVDVDSLASEVEKAIIPAKKEASKYSKFILTPEQIQRSVSLTMWFQTVKSLGSTADSVLKDFKKWEDKLINDILEGKPIVVDPPVIYYFLTSSCMLRSENLKKLEGRDEDARMLREFIADLVRLYHVQRQFTMIKETKKDLKKKLNKLREKTET